jgi:hypothetical protein
MIYIFTYGTYILISVFVIAYVGYKLHLDGGVWIASLMEDSVMAILLNNLLLMGYYLVNIGFIFYTFSSWGNLISWANSINELSHKLSIILLLLGYLHYQNIILINIFFTFKHSKKWKL